MIKKLEWDSKFFSRKIGSISINTETDIEDFYIEAKQYDIVYVFSENSININADLADIRRIYTKKVNHHKDSDLNPKHEINNFDSKIHDYKKLLELVYISGHESRWFKDSLFGGKYFKKLYKLWIDKNISQRNSYVLIYQIESRIAGFVAFSIENEKASIELIAVDFAYQGKGIGKKLMKTVENRLPKDYVLTVPTQESNIGACNFYLKYGFRLEKKRFTYHYVTK